MDYGEHVAAVERESARIVEGLRAGSVEDAVPTCPDWTLTDLGVHVGQFCGLWSHVLCEGAGRSKTPFPDPPRDGDSGERLATWVEEQAGHLLGQLRLSDAGAPAWTWDEDDQTAGFIARRGAHELAVHRYDAQSARPPAEPINSALAIDGIEEIFAMIAAWRAAGREIGVGAGETIHLHAAKDDAEWMITLSPDGPIVDRHHAKADLALTGSVSDLELVLYQRPPIGSVDHFGDESVLAAWQRAFTF